ncbi:MAG: threonine/serine ThrE exporter family protein [Atopobiaceae bacterium]|jgi:uncharacterized membrane protein YjjP (DUF1212 family)
MSNSCACTDAAHTPHRMDISWHEDIDPHVLLAQASFEEQARLIGRVGLMMLSVGTGAWRVVESMNTVARKVGITCTVDAGLCSLNFTCSRQGTCMSQSLVLNSTGVNTYRLCLLGQLMREIDQRDDMTLAEIHERLDEISSTKGLYTPFQAGLSAGASCGAFTFLLGAGALEMLVAFIGAFFGNWLRRHMIDRHTTLIPTVMTSVALACISAILFYKIFELMGANPVHESGYPCAMLFIIPGFPLITGGIDLAKSDMRSGMERICHALIIITTATFTGWIVALAFSFNPADLTPVTLNPLVQALLRATMSFVGVFGFSQMFNSTPKMAASAGLIGAISNTLRLELTSLAGCPAPLASLIGATCAGLLASRMQKHTGYPRISLTVPSIVIMVPGLFMYRAVYHLALGNSADGVIWLFNATFMVLALPLGLILARTLTDKRFRSSI